MRRQHEAALLVLCLAFLLVAVVLAAQPSPSAVSWTCEPYDTCSDARNAP